ncbi:PHP domain-containing protein [Chitinophaga sedimenti]|uniref:PHP domain-containing protein n=1 Tax=Chitinophaga sedimenti TaxID=2033606 RepID=UPI002006BCE9|nr:PHP domain-containing protein [Chitinophaga sedimenti]MCK7559374.1 PHP domain-containing protein [Chitinophaga sedimenti]
MLLNVHSAHSLRYGTIAIEQLLDLLIDHGHQAAVLTDINNTSAALEFIRACQQRNFHGLVGIEFRNDDQLCFIGIARNNEGFYELNKLLTLHLCSKKPFAATAPEFSNVTIVYPYDKKQQRQLRSFEYWGSRQPTDAAL